MSRLYVVGIGPGKTEGMTLEAQEVLAHCETIAGYTVYTELVKAQFPEKKYIITSMRKEVERCRLALQAAADGSETAMICSGDAGVYGMAGLILELGQKFPEVEVVVVPGVSAVLSGAAVLGAPVGHDFAVISLSDLLTPWEKIEGRLRAAAEADFSVCLYNPSSKKRAGYLKRACEILMEKKSGDTVCGVVKNIGRDGETRELMTLSELSGYEADMFTTVFVGNSQTEAVENGRWWMVTPRGYRL